MTPERYQQIDQLADAAMELGVEERATFLDQACAGNEELRRQVEQLLSALEHEDGFLSAPAHEAIAQEMAADQAQSLIGRQLGHYQILSLLGVGGMCEVYNDIPIQFSPCWLENQGGGDICPVTHLKRYHPSFSTEFSTKYLHRKFSYKPSTCNYLATSVNRC